MSDTLQSDATFSDAAGRIAALRRVSGPEIVDDGIQLARQNYGALLLAALVPLLPYFGADIWFSSYPGSLGPWPMLLFTAVWTAWYSLAAASAARVAMDALEGRPVDTAGALRTTLRQAWPVMVPGPYLTVLGFLGSILLVIPGFYILSVYALMPALPVLEPGLGGWQALRRSAKLTDGARLLAFGANVVPSTFVFGAGVVLNMLTARILGPHGGRLFGGLVGSSATVASIPFISAIQVRLYVELRMRKEAIDIEWALASPSAAVGT